VPEAVIEYTGIDCSCKYRSQVQQPKSGDLSPGDTVFESIAVLTTLSLLVIFGALLRMEYRGRQQDKQDADHA
jgi:hypothetical protein